MAHCAESEFFSSLAAFRFKRGRLRPWTVKFIFVHFLNRYLFKGTVARDFLAYGSALYGPQISRLKGFSFLFCFREVIWIFRWFRDDGYSGDSKIIFWGFQNVDNHACILLRIKNTRGIHRKVATVLRPLWAWNRGQLVVHRTDSEQEVPNRRLSSFLDTLQLLSTTPSTTPIYNSSLLLRSTEPTIDYCGRSAYLVNYYYHYYYFCHYPGRLRLQSQERFKNC